MILILVYVFTFVHITCTLYWLRVISEVQWNGMLLLLFSCVQLLSHVQLCDLMDCSMPSSCVLHYLTEFDQTHVYQDSGASMFWTLWEKARVGWFGRMALKHVYCHMWKESPVLVWCMRQGAWGWCTGMTQRDGMRGRWEGGSGWGHIPHNIVK